MPLLAVPSAGLLPTVLAALGVAAAGCHLAIDGELSRVRCTEEGAYGPPACPEGETCVAGECLETGVPLGGACASDLDCAWPARCLDPAPLGDASGAFCSIPCCSSADCGPVTLGQVCHAWSGGAARFCWPAGRLGRILLGDRLAGQPCGPNRVCRSGLCASGACIDVCCDDRFCSVGDQRCVVQVAGGSGAPTWQCGQPSTTSADPTSCTADEQCATGRCLALDAETRICAVPCCSSSTCGAIELGAERLQLACATSRDGALTACSRVVPTSAVGAVGAPCVEDDECRSGVCAEQAGVRFCTDRCCRDEDCGNTTLFACRLAAGSVPWSLQCVRK